MVARVARDGAVVHVDIALHQRRMTAMGVRRAKAAARLPKAPGSQKRLSEHPSSVRLKRASLPAAIVATESVRHRSQLRDPAHIPSEFPGWLPTFVRPRLCRLKRWNDFRRCIFLFRIFPCQASRNRELVDMHELVDMADSHAASKGNR
jgi:hypothetical protein